MDEATPIQRFDEFLEYLQRLTMKSSSSSDSDDVMVTRIRNNIILRRLASLAMRPNDEGKHTPSVIYSEVGQQLIRIWPRLLELPALEPMNKSPFSISLIMPCYRENGADVRSKLQHAFSTCLHPDRVQVVLVDAGKCKDLTLTSTVDSQQRWAQVKLVSFLTEAGRGPGLNYGAQHATGALFAFCHADTRLPDQWDTKMVDIFYEQPVKKRANSCAFGFGIDTSVEGLNGDAFPPGIRAVEMTANLRSHWWSLPYGDQCLTIPASTFHFLGGFPHQPFMEDYEMIALLRKRAALLPRFGMPAEALKIVPGPPALCSPRRWQRFGVLHVTYMNSKLVNLYAGGMTPYELYERYYGHALAPSTRESPWESQIQPTPSSHSNHDSRVM